MDMRHKFSVELDTRPFPRRIETTRSILDLDYDWLGSRPDTTAAATRMQARQHADGRFSERLETAMADEPDEDERIGLGFWIGVGVTGTLTTVALVQALGLSVGILRSFL